MNSSDHSTQPEAAEPQTAETAQADGQQRDPLTPLAWGISFLMHPLPMPTIMFGLVLLFTPELMLSGNSEIRWQLMALIFLATFALPGLSVLTLRMFGNISSLTMSRREDRRIPFLFVSAIYMVVTYFFYKSFPQIPFVVLGLLSITASLLALTTISLYWKISAHGIGAGGATGFLTALMLHNRNPELIFPLAILMCLSGAVLWARLYLNHHSPAEAWAGWLTGFSICAGMVVILYPIL